MNDSRSRGSFRLGVQMPVATLILSGAVLMSAELRADPSPASESFDHDHDVIMRAIPSPRHQGVLDGVFEGTGADNCADATVVPITVGTPTDPATIVILGDNTPATGPDCDTVFNGAPMWWEAFEIDVEAEVLVLLCGTDPVQRPSTP